MAWKRKLRQNCRLYLILDTQVNSYSQLAIIAQKSVSAGVDIIQLRDKQGTAKAILDFSKWILRMTRGRIPYIINDRADLALAAKASGVHVGQEDLPVCVARKMLGDRAIIGVSCQTLRQAKDAQSEGADYIGFGSVFKTQTKPDRKAMDLQKLKMVMREVTIPLFAIGGITAENISIIREKAEAGRFAVCRSICCSKDVAKQVQNLKARILV